MNRWDSPPGWEAFFQGGLKPDPADKIREMPDIVRRIQIGRSKYKCTNSSRDRVLKFVNMKNNGTISKDKFKYSIEVMVFRNELEPVE